MMFYLVKVTLLDAAAAAAADDDDQRDDNFLTVFFSCSVHCIFVLCRATRQLLSLVLSVCLYHASVS